MVSIENFRQMALSFPQVTEQSHFETASFKVVKKIFATLDEGRNRACLKLSETDQSVFTAFDKTAVYPVPNKWGKQGWTFVELQTVQPDLLADALQCAYRHTAPPKLAALLPPPNMAD